MDNISKIELDIFKKFKLPESSNNIYSIYSLLKSWPHCLPDLSNFISPSFYTKTKSLPIRIALLDTGIQTAHPSFIGAKLITRDFSGSYNAEDEVGHGTHCAAILVSQAHSGMIGIVPDTLLYLAKIWSIRRSKTSRESSIIRALEWAIKENVHIILITLGRRYSSPAIKAIIKMAINRGILIIASAGNHGGSLPLFPASVQKVICISALDLNGAPLAECYQGHYVDAFIPGEKILSARLGGWGEMSGSSQAAAIFCGLLAQYIKHSIHESGNVTHKFNIRYTL